MSKEAPVCEICGEYADGCHCLPPMPAPAELPGDSIALKIFHAVNHGQMERANELVRMVSTVNVTCLNHTDAECKAAGLAHCPVCRVIERDDLREMVDRLVYCFNEGSEMELFAALEAANKLKAKYA